MIVVDSSAIASILFEEQEARRFRLMMAAETSVLMSAVTDYETRIVGFQRNGQRVIERYDELVAEAGVSIMPFDRHQSGLAFDAYCRFGKGNHPARLNLADCAAYALAKSLDAPLLFKGYDFVLTDVRVAA